ACGPQHGVNRLRIRGIESKVGGAAVFIFVENFLEGLSALGGAENAALCVGTIGVSFGSDENAVGIFRVDENRGDLLGVPQTEMRPGFSRVGGFVNAIAGREIGALQSLAAANVNDVRIGVLREKGEDTLAAETEQCMECENVHPRSLSSGQAGVAVPALSPPR